MQIKFQTPGRPKRITDNYETHFVKNALCPHYDACLDMAVKKEWQQFDCSECEHRNTHRRLAVRPRETDNNPYYGVSPEIGKKWAK